VNDGQWHYAVAVYTGTAAQLYVEGSLRRGGSGDGIARVNNFAVRIGEDATTTGRYWHGQTSAKWALQIGPVGP